MNDREHLVAVKGGNQTQKNDSNFDIQNKQLVQQQIRSLIPSQNLQLFNKLPQMKLMQWFGKCIAIGKLKTL
jgi:hypothetical protein